VPELEIFNAGFDAFKEFPNLGLGSLQLPAGGVPGRSVGQ